MRGRDVSPRFFVDRNLGSVIIPDGLRSAGWDVTTMDDRYGVDVSQSVSDVDWIREATQRGEFLLTKDVRIARNPVEARIVHMCDARVFTITNQRIPAPTALEWLVRHQAAIFVGRHVPIRRSSSDL
ncbi:hypothetical protein GCM10009809_29470 [Isoptericola hypogeus]|uniref:VapC45 PIN like domain-containing protein n=1 Tax=Isoptericola hypogeus TaxID=300179 RepID=A0ABN2JMX2_9MICO